MAQNDSEIENQYESNSNSNNNGNVVTNTAKGKAVDMAKKRAAAVGKSAVRFLISLISVKAILIIIGIILLIVMLARFNFICSFIT